MGNAWFLVLLRASGLKPESFFIRTHLCIPRIRLAYMTYGNNTAFLNRLISLTKALEALGFHGFLLSADPNLCNVGPSKRTDVLCKKN